MTTKQSEIATTAVVAVAFALDMAIARINRKNHKRNLEVTRELETENEALRAALQTSANQVNYLSMMLDEHNVPVTEFDRIALNSLS